MWFAIANHIYMCHIMCKRILIFKFELRGDRQKYKLPQIWDAHKNCYALQNLERDRTTLLPFKFCGTSIRKKIYF